ncbi:hypothetical protein [Streptomyces sp. HUAS TT7]|uniref:hypothetical protein n=1 Tax=Streptomyces sp. HUAS TT7 TaxID=3447507 RepID=UPI003F6555B2
MAMYCDTCKSDEEHRPLDAEEKAWLRHRTGRKNVEDVWVCMRPGCRNLRTGFDKRPFAGHIRLP